MKTHILHRTFLFLLAFSLSACLGPKTPQEVTQAFWSAVIENDAKDAVKYSTLTDTRYYDRFSGNWDEYTPSIGKVTIDKKEAIVVTELTSPANSDMKNRRVTTYLTQRDGEWKVDYDRTKSSVQGGALGSLLNQLSRLGEDLSRQLEASSDQFSKEMDRMGNELEQLSRSFEQEASKTIDKYVDELRQSIRELEESIDRALENEDKNLSENDKRSLQAISDKLEQDNKNLSEPNAQVIAESSRNIGAAQQQLNTIENRSLDKYKDEWHEFGKQFAEDMRKLLEELTSDTNARGAKQYEL